MTKQEMMKMIAEGNSVSQMSKITGKSKGSIRYWMNKFELKTKNKLYNKKDVYECRGCGETKESKMKNCGSGRKAFTICQSCYNKDTVQRGRQKKIDLVKMMGGKCLDCGYSKNYAALEFHHIDPDAKDPDFKSLRYWSLERASGELQNCVLLCSNCHRERHNPDFKTT